MKIGVIGVGRIGGTLAKQYREAGHDVVIANSRGPETLAEFAQQIDATPVTVSEAAKNSDVVVISIPLAAIADLPADLFEGVPDSVPVIDTTNYYLGIRGAPKIEEIDAGMPESEWVGRQLGRPVVKVYSSILAHSLAEKARPKGTPGRLALPVAADDQQARAMVLALVDETGFDGVDAGPIAESWRFQPGTPAYCTDLDARATERALSMADRQEAPRRLVEILQAYAEMGRDATPEDIVRRIRAIVGIEPAAERR